MEKIHQPGPGVTTFALYGFFAGEPQKRHLVLKADRQSPLLFLAGHRVPTNLHPPAMVMRLRKHLSDRRVAAARCDWPERRLYLEMAPNAEFPAPVWLCLDLREGPSLLFSPPPAPVEPQWPDMPFFARAALHDSPDGNAEALASAPGDSAWRSWPVLTPALRRTLPYLDPEDADALLVDLRAGGGDVFLYENDAGRREVSAWPLPLVQLVKSSKGGAKGKAWRESVWDDPLAALALAGETQVYAETASRAAKEAAKPHAAEVERLSRLQAKLDREEERLRALCAKQEAALLLQAELYRFGPDEKLAAVTLRGPGESGVSDAGGPREIPLDPRLTVRENMAALFHQAGRGKRGLEHLIRRREAVEAEKAAAVDAMLRNEAASGGARPVSGAKNAPRPTTQPSGQPSGKPSAQGSAQGGGLPKQVQVFRSSDGFVLLRGRDTKGNLLALKLAAPHDYWLHAAHGPSAHVIIRRDHAGREVPERTLQEAGALAALKSPLRLEARAEIQYSLAKHIRPMKNAGPGMVRIDRSEGAFWVDIDPDLEDRLAG